MLMKLRDRFPSWRNPLYSLPTLRGLIPLGLTMVAGYLSFTRGSPPHQWLVVLMSLLTVMHLIESSTDLRELELDPDPDACIFAGIPAKIPLLPRRGFLKAPLDLEVLYRSPGVHPFPEKRVVMVPDSGLFRYWRSFEFQRQAFVLPPPIDHGVPLDVEDSHSPQDPDELVPIRDPRLLPLRDPKIFMKSGKSVLRARATEATRGCARLDWEALVDLPHPLRFEQLSFWIQILEASPQWLEHGIEVSVPFFPDPFIQTRSEWRRFKQALARAGADA